MPPHPHHHHHHHGGGGGGFLPGWYGGPWGYDYPTTSEVFLVDDATRVDPCPPGYVISKKTGRCEKPKALAGLGDAEVLGMPLWMVAALGVGGYLIYKKMRR